MRVILLGMKHSGKSTLGRRLAAGLGCPFYDVDSLIEDRSQTEDGAGLTVREIYRRVGAEGFAEIERKAVMAFYDSVRDGGGDYVLALGGRTPLNPDLRPVLRRMGTLVFLDVDPERLWERVSRNGIPPFVDPDRPRDDFLDLHRSREAAYREIADITVELDARKSPEENTGGVRRALEAHCGGR